jgi:hypothetical protein
MAKKEKLAAVESAHEETLAIAAAPPTPSGMNFANFGDINAAAAWRAEYGGHLFATESGDVFWFSLKAALTPSMVMRHPALRYRQGVLNPHKQQAA